MSNAVDQLQAKLAQQQKDLEDKHFKRLQQDPMLGATPDSLRKVKGWEGITDEALKAREGFDIRKHKAQVTDPKQVDLRRMTAEELRGLIEAATMQLKSKEQAHAIDAPA